VTADLLPLDAWPWSLLSSRWVAPLATRHLADAGAWVIKIERNRESRCGRLRSRSTADGVAGRAAEVSLAPHGQIARDFPRLRPTGPYRSAAAWGTCTGPGRAVLQRRPAAPPLRRHQRDPAPDHRQPARAGAPIV